MKNIGSIDWRFGFKVELGYLLPHDGWDLSLNWTRFNHDTQKENSVDLSKERIFTQGIASDNFDSGFPVGEFFYITQKVKAKWDLDFNTLNLQIGHSYWVGNALMLKPQVGLTSAWINQDYDIHYTNLFSYDSGIASKVFSKKDNDFWGIGCIAGLNSRYAFAREWSIYGNLADHCCGDFSMSAQNRL